MAKRSQSGAQVSWWESLLAGISAVLIVAILGFLVAQAVRGRDGAPDVHITLRESREVGGRFLVSAELKNEGELTAAGLNLEAVLFDGDSIVERSRVTLDYLPAGGTREAGFFFLRDPRRARLQLRVEGFQRP